MKNATKFYIDGRWVDPCCAGLSRCDRSGDGKAVREDRHGFARRRRCGGERSKARVSQVFHDDCGIADRVLREVPRDLRRRQPEIAQIVTREMGSPISFSMNAQTATCVAHLESIISVLKHYEFRETIGTTAIVKEPIGVVGLITPWNWPLNQVAARCAGACGWLHHGVEAERSRAVECDPLRRDSHEAGVPAGVFNLVNGDGPGVGRRWPSTPMWTWCRSPAPRALASGGAKRGADGETCRTRAGRQIRQHHPRRRGFRSRRPRRRIGVLLQQRPIVRCADAYAGPSRSL